METGVPTKHEESKDIFENGSNITFYSIMQDANNIVSKVNERHEKASIMKSHFGFSIQNFKIENSRISFRGQFLGYNSRIVYTYDFFYNFYNGNRNECLREWEFVSQSLDYFGSTIPS